MSKYLITSALPYINGVKHLGNLVGSMLPADVASRYLRMNGHEVVFICGTDEHGAPAEIAARQEKMFVDSFCDKYHFIQKGTYEKFNLSFDYFGRTSNDSNIKITQEYFLKLYENNWIVEKSIKQMYSEKDEMFLADRYIEGICPKCSSDGARGDQCDSCGSLLSPDELINPRSTLSGDDKLILKETKHLFLNLESLQPKVERFVNENKNNWPKTVSGIAQKWLKEGLKQRSITRDLKWGVKVPLEDYSDKVFYVWFDAPFGYISFTQEYFKHSGDLNQWKEYWQNPETTYVQFMAKDNVPFHSIFWPAVILGTGENINLPKIIKGMDWLNFEGGKFSTSKNRGIFLDKALDLFPSDYWRYYLLKIIPENGDSNFTWSGFQEAVNKDLADTLGNFINRVVIFLRKNNQGVIPLTIEIAPLVKENIITALIDISKELDKFKFITAIKCLHKFWHFGNQYFNDTEPFKVVKSDKEKALNYVSNCILLVKHYAVVSAPFIPDISQMIFNILGLTDNVADEKWEIDLDWNKFAGKKIPTEKNILIKKIDNKDLERVQSNAK